MLSLGTGDPPTEKVDSVDLRLPDSILGVVSAVSGASAMGRLLVDQAASATTMFQISELAKRQLFLLPKNHSNVHGPTGKRTLS